MVHNELEVTRVVTRASVEFTADDIKRLEAAYRKVEAARRTVGAVLGSNMAMAFLNLLDALLGTDEAWGMFGSYLDTDWSKW